MQVHAGGISPGGESNLKRHENAVRVCNIITERRADLKAEALVQRARRLEPVHAAGFQAETGIAAPPGFCDDMFEHLPAEPCAAIARQRMHGFHLAMAVAQMLQCAAAHQRLVIAHFPDRDVVAAQSIHGQEMATAGR